jgi:tetratricopeptide (TPR) repeat protein
MYWMFYDQASGRRWCDAVIEAGVDVAPRSRAKALLSAGMMAQNDLAWEGAAVRSREALAIYRAEGLIAGQAASLFWLGRALVNWSGLERSEDHAAEATRCFEESIRLFTRLGDWVGVGSCRSSLCDQAYWDGDLDRCEQLAHQVVQECGAAGVRYPVGQALSYLAFIARRRGRNDTALKFLEDAAAIYRDLDDPWQLSSLLVDLAATEAALGRGAEALQALAESSQLDEQIGRLPSRSFRLAVAAFVHDARGQHALSVSALGAYDAHPAGAKGWGWSSGGYAGWLREAVATTRAHLDPAAVIAATATARGKSLEKLLDELIIQPAQAAM